MKYARIAAVTGANKGIGYAIVRKLALTYPQSALNTGPLLIYLTARDRSRGEAAVASIRADADLRAAKALDADGGPTSVSYLPLDISSDASIAEFAQTIGAAHPDGVDVLVNNAGVALDGFDADQTRATLRPNYYGTLGVCDAMLPRMRPGGRVVNVSSVVGKLNKYSEEITRAFRAAESVEDVTALMRAFEAGVADGTYADSGWPTSAYAVSKAGLTGASRVLGRREALAGRGVLLNACCPGYVNTELTKGRGRKTPDEGAETPVHLALADLHGVAGEFWERNEVSAW